MIQRSKSRNLRKYRVAIQEDKASFKKSMNESVTRRFRKTSLVQNGDGLV